MPRQGYTAGRIPGVVPADKEGFNKYLPAHYYPNVLELSKGSYCPGSGTFLPSLAKVYLSKLPLPVPLLLALLFSLFIFLGACPRKINNEKNKANGYANGNGNFDRHIFARFSQNVPPHVL